MRKGHLNGVSALSPADVWAAGETGGDAVFEHFDGTAWRRVPSPLWSHVSMGAVTAVSAADVWAVGEVATRRPGPRSIRSQRSYPKEDPSHGTSGRGLWDRYWPASPASHLVPGSGSSRRGATGVLPGHADTYAADADGDGHHNEPLRNPLAPPKVATTAIRCVLRCHGARGGTAAPALAPWKT
jgi:hypothetical protein